MDTKNWKRRFSKGFKGGEDSQPTDKPKLSYSERVAARKAKMTPEEVAERQRKIDSQKSSYQDGGTACTKNKDKKAKLLALAKLAKSKG